MCSSDLTASTYSNPVVITTPAVRMGNEDVVEDITTYPEPATDHFFIRLAHPSVFPTLVEITDLSGRIILSNLYDFSDPVVGAIEVNISELPAGYYAVRIVNGESTLLGKVIITGE